MHGEETVAGLHLFYLSVATLFESGMLGGGRITAIKPYTTGRGVGRRAVGVAIRF